MWPQRSSFLAAMLLVGCATGSSPMLERVATLSQSNYVLAPATERAWASSVVARIAAVLPVQDGPVAECDRLAADPLDPQKRTTGVAFDDIDGRLALRACGIAADTSPLEARFRYQLARAYFRLGQTDTAQKLLIGLAEADYAAAQEALGSLWLRRGEGTGADLAPAVRWLVLAAENGMAGAAFALGGLHAEGRGVDRSIPQAIRWFRRAADLGHPRAATVLGRLHLQGSPPAIVVDPKRAGELLTQAAALEEPGAQYLLGTLYLRGVGVAAEPLTARGWFERAAAWGHPLAQAIVGLVRFEQGTPRDLEEAAMWFALAETAGVDGLSKTRAAVEAQLTPEQRRRAAESAAAFVPGPGPDPAVAKTPAPADALPLPAADDARAATTPAPDPVTPGAGAPREDAPNGTSSSRALRGRT